MVSFFQTYVLIICPSFCFLNQEPLMAGTITAVTSREFHFTNLLFRNLSNDFNVEIKLERCPAFFGFGIVSQGADILCIFVCRYLEGTLTGLVASGEILHIARFGKGEFQRFKKIITVTKIT